MAAELTNRSSETAVHLRLKRLALIWAQAHGYSACANEVCLPRCRFRADVAACRHSREDNCAAIFECKQALPDLRRDNCQSESARTQLALLETRRGIIERNLRVHYPTLRSGETLFPEYDAWDFSEVAHRGYSRVLRNGTALEHRLLDCTKFEKLARYRCANLFYLVIAAPLGEIAFELPGGWGLLLENGPALELLHKPVWHEMTPEWQGQFLRRVATAATRAVNREVQITREEIDSARSL
ncbi:MAG: hypothetical protein JO354_05315 [Verrucomicrobia bacterium]|nr:hypothetical protein [Verrucomicrobiota bacterium]